MVVGHRLMRGDHVLWPALMGSGREQELVRTQRRVVEERTVWDVVVRLNYVSTTPVRVYMN